MDRDAIEQTATELGIQLIERPPPVLHHRSNPCGSGVARANSNAARQGLVSGGPVSPVQRTPLAGRQRGDGTT